MRQRTSLISAILLVFFMLSLVFNPMIYAYIPYSPIEAIIRDKQRAVLELDCIGWIIPMDKYHGLQLTGGNALCLDNKGRNVYEYIRFNITLSSPGVWVYENVFYFYLNVSGHRQVEIVVEKPTSRDSMIFLFRNRDGTIIALNASRVERQVVYVTPGVTIYTVSIIIYSRTTSRESLRIGAYISLT